MKPTRAQIHRNIMDQFEKLCSLTHQLKWSARVWLLTIIMQIHNKNPNVYYNFLAKHRGFNFDRDKSTFQVVLDQEESLSSSFFQSMKVFIDPYLFLLLANTFTNRKFIFSDWVIGKFWSSYCSHQNLIFMSKFLEVTK